MLFLPGATRFALALAIIFRAVGAQIRVFVQSHLSWKLPNVSNV
jgi:hypothetical protein